MPTLSEDLTAEILSRLPVKALTRFKSVSKDFNSSISHDPIFLQLHRLQSQKQNLCFLSMDFSNKLFSNSKTTTIHLSTSNPQRKPITSFSKMINTDGRAITDLLPSYHHLVCIAARDKIYILNPSTEELLPLPKSSVPIDHCAVGFGYLPSNKEYKVLKLTYLDIDFDNPDNWVIQPEILTITPPTNNLHGLRYSSWRVLQDNCSFVAEGPCVFVNWFLFWKIYGGLPGRMILAFDLEQEVFTTLPAPSDISDASNFDIAGIRGDLWLVGYPQQFFIMELWVLKGLEENLTWTKIFRFDCRKLGIELPFEMRQIDVRKMKPVDIPNEEEILFEVDDQEVRLMRFNVKTKTWKSEFYNNIQSRFCYYTNSCL